jgi:iron complex outermembrane recepter protein
MEKLIILLSFISVFQATNAQVNISGKITDKSKEPIIGVNIFVIQQNKGTVSNENGEFKLNNLPKGKINIEISSIGYQNDIETLILQDSLVTLNIVLKEAAIETDEIVVSGGYNSTQHENAVKIDVFKLSDVSNTNSPNFTEILTKVPGIDMISKGNGVAKPVIRGLAMNDILVLNNGVRFENYQYSDHHPLGIDEFGIGNVEIIKGPASLLYGSDAIGGVIDFIKENPAPVGSLVGDYNLQMFSNSLGVTNNIGIKGSTKNFRAGIRFGNKTNSDYLQGGGDFVPNTRFNSNSLKISTGFNNKNMALNLYYDYSKHKLGLAEPDAIEYVKEQGRSRTSEVYYMQLENHLLSSQNKFFLNRFKLEINAAFQNSGLIHSEGLDTISIDMNLHTFTYETRLYFPSSKKSEYIIGFQGFNQKNVNLNNRETILLPDASIANYSCFGLVQYTFFDKLKLQSGIRYDYKQIYTSAVGLAGEPTYRQALEKNYGSISGSFGATYNITDKLLFRYNFATAYRTPNLPELTSNGLHETRYELGDNSLVPENAFENDLSFHYHSNNFTIDLAGFYNYILNYIYIAPSADTTSQGIRIYKYGQSNAFLHGFEAGFHIHPKIMDWLHFETTFSNVTGKKDNGDYLPYIPANKLKFEFRIEKKKLGFLYDAYFKTNSLTAFDQNNPAPEETATRGYTLFDVGIGADIKIAKQFVSIGIGANNVFDKKYVDHLSTLKEVSYFNPGRNIVFSLKIPFGNIK